MAKSDRELVDYRYWLSSDQDPEEMLDLLEWVRGEDQPRPELEHIYDRAPPQGASRRLVRCAYFGRRVHYKGYVLQYPDGKRVLVGHNCGSDAYGLWFHEKAAEFDRQMVRAEILKRLNRVVIALAPAIAELTALLDNDWVAGAAEPARTFKNRFPKLCDRVLGASDGRLRATVQVRDTEAERRRDNRIDAEIGRRARSAGMPQEDYEQQYRDVIRSDPDLQKDPLFTTEEQEVERLDGHRYLTVALGNIGEKLEQQVEHLRRQVRQFATLQTDPLGTDAINGIVKDLRRDVGGIAGEIDALADGVAFFGASNRNALARWSRITRTDEGSYTADGDGLTLKLRSGQMFPFTPRPRPVPPLPALARLRREFDS